MHHIYHSYILLYRCELDNLYNYYSMHELKLALIEQNERNNCTKINLDYLYEQDLRYKLAWATWNLNSNITME